jgi:hypothetical protein
MAFKAIFIAHAPDADVEKHHNLIDTGAQRGLTVSGIDFQEPMIVAARKFFPQAHFQVADSIQSVMNILSSFE